MSITVLSSDPAQLLSDIKAAIQKKSVETWAIDADGDFFHTPDQWRGEAWFRPSVNQGMLVFGLLKRKDKEMTKLIYGIYHGRFIEMLLVHFDTQFGNVLATALISSDDYCK